MFTRNLSALLWDEILKPDFQVVEVIPLSGLKFRQHHTFLAKKQAIINAKKTENRFLAYAVLAALQSARRTSKLLNPLLERQGLETIQNPASHDQILANAEKLKV